MGYNKLRSIVFI